jgi:hypothetical protein
MRPADVERRENLVRREWWTASEAAFILGTQTRYIRRIVNTNPTIEHEWRADDFGQWRMLIKAESIRTWWFNPDRRTRRTRADSR